MGPYGKFILAALAAILAAVGPGLVTDTDLGLSGVVNIAILALGALQVLNAPNVTWWGYAKGIAAAISAGAVVFVSAYSDASINASEWVQIALAVVVGIGGVIGISNGPNYAAKRPVA